MSPEFAEDTEGIRMVYEYMILKAGENDGALDKIDTTYILGNLQMWLLDHEALAQDVINQRGPQYAPDTVSKAKGWFLK